MLKSLRGAGGARSAPGTLAVGRDRGEKGTFSLTRSNNRVSHGVPREDDYIKGNRDGDEPVDPSTVQRADGIFEAPEPRGTLLSRGHKE